MKLNQLSKGLYDFYYNLFNSNTTERLKSQRKQRMKSRNHHRKHFEYKEAEVRMMDKILRERKKTK